MKTAHEILISKMTISDQSEISSFTLARIKDAMREYAQQTANMYKDCLEEFLPIDKWDEATEFLSVYDNGLAEEFKKRNQL